MSDEFLEQITSEDATRALFETNQHYRSVIYAIDEFLHRLTDATNSSGTYCATKEDFITALKEDRAEFKSRIREITAA